MGTDNYAPTFAGSIIINGTTLDIVISMSIMGNDTAYIEGEGYDLPKANANIQDIGEDIAIVLKILFLVEQNHLIYKSNLEKQLMILQMQIYFLMHLMNV